LYLPSQTVGWFAGFDLGLVKPHLRTSLVTPEGFSGPTGNPITLPNSTLDWTVLPEWTLGYRFSDGAGDLRLKYRLLNSSGSETFPSNGLDFMSPVVVRTRLNVQTIDLDYVIPEYLSEGRDISWLFFRQMSGGVGLRTAVSYFDSKAAGLPAVDTHVSSNFAGVGPRMFLDLHKDLSRPDVSFYSRLQASGVFGPIRQQFAETLLTDGGPTSAFFDTHNRNTGIGTLQAEAGLSWEPARFQRRVRVTAAFTWERWWNFGSTDASNAELTVQGLLLRAELRY
jgi:hypothetical protein